MRACASAATLLVTLLLGITACGGGATSPESGLQLARARWAQRAPASYTVTVRRSCECLPETIGPVDVTVRDGVVTSRRYVPSGDAVEPQHAAAFPSVDGLFDLIEGAIQRGVHPVYVQFDDEWGYPTSATLGNPSVDAPVYHMSELRVE